MTGVPLIHCLKPCIALMNGNHRALRQRIELGVCDYGRDFDHRVVFRVETRHLQVDPDQVLFAEHLGFAS